MNSLRRNCVFALSLAISSGLAAQGFPVNTDSAAARAHFAKGVSALDASRVDDARSHFDAALRADDGFAAAYLWRAYSATSGADWQQAMDGAKAHREGASPYIQIEIDAMQAGVSNDSKRTLELAQALVSRYPDNPRAHVNLASEYANHKAYDAQRAALMTAIALDADFAPAFQQMANSYIFNEPKDYTKAEHFARRLVEVAPAESNSYIVLGDALRARSDLTEARDAYADATTINPAHAVAHIKAGHANTFLGNYDAARANFRAAAEAAGSFGSKVGAMNFGAFTHLYAGDVEAGLKANAQVLKTIEDSVLAREEITFPLWNTLWQRGQVAMHHGKFEEAEKAFGRRKALTEEAIKQVNQPAWATTQRASDVLISGLLAAHRGNLDAARAAAEKHHEMLAQQNNERRYEGYHLLMGLIEAKSGDAQAALEHLAQADDQDPLVKLHRAEALEAAENIDQAKAVYQEIMEYNFNSVNTALARTGAQARLEQLES